MGWIEDFDEQYGQGAARTAIRAMRTPDVAPLPAAFDYSESLRPRRQPAWFDGLPPALEASLRRDLGAAVAESRPRTVKRMTAADLLADWPLGETERDPWIGSAEIMREGYMLREVVR